jgi:NAD(P)-dependent dehydrogenase (short-subunit alcohol dehydrogenase family)
VQVKDRVAIITSGVGDRRATSFAFAREAAKVLVDASNLSRLEEVAEELKGFSETLAIEAGKHNIRVNCFSPGATRTQEFEDWVKTSAKTAVSPTRR